MKGNAPKSPATGSQLEPVKNLKPNCAMVKRDLVINSYRRSATTIKTESEQANIAYRKPVSAILLPIEVFRAIRRTRAGSSTGAGLGPSGFWPGFTMRRGNPSAVLGTLVFTTECYQLIVNSLLKRDCRTANEEPPTGLVRPGGEQCPRFGAFRGPSRGLSAESRKCCSSERIHEIQLSPL